MRPGKFLRRCFIGSEADTTILDSYKERCRVNAVKFDAKVMNLMRQVQDEVDLERQVAIDLEALQMPRVPWRHTKASS